MTGKSTLSGANLPNWKPIQDYLSKDLCSFPALTTTAKEVSKYNLIPKWLSEYRFTQLETRTPHAHVVLVGRHASQRDKLRTGPVLTRIGKDLLDRRAVDSGRGLTSTCLHRDTDILGLPYHVRSLMRTTTVSAFWFFGFNRTEDKGKYVGETA